MIGTWPHATRYGAEDSYKIGMEWLEPCLHVEDWGCGPAYSKKYRKGYYCGIDGTEGFCDQVADLREHRSTVEGVFMRHVLEHNLEWQKILRNALDSFTERMTLIFFTPWCEETHIKNYDPNGFPVICFKKQDILQYIEPYLKGEDIVYRKDKPMSDTVFRLAK